MESAGSILSINLSFIKTEPLKLRPSLTMVAFLISVVLINRNSFPMELIQQI
jgi:hypothetical protein